MAHVCSNVQKLLQLEMAIYTAGPRSALLWQSSKVLDGASQSLPSSVSRPVGWMVLNSDDWMIQFMSLAICRRQTVLGPRIFLHVVGIYIFSFPPTVHSSLPPHRIPHIHPLHLVFSQKHLIHHHESPHTH